MNGTKEIYDLMDAFEKAWRTLPVHSHRLTRAAREEHEHRNYYDDGYTNVIFLSFMAGYALGKSMYQERDHA